MANKKYISENNQLDEFKSVDGHSEVPDSGSYGSTARAADKSTGEASYSDSTKAEVMAKLMNDLQARSADEVLDIYKAVASTNNSVNKRSADKMSGGGETYDDVNPGSVVKPVVAREHIEEIFTGQELSEELLNKAAIVYEAAVNARISIVEARLEEQYTAALEEAIDLIHEEVVESVDKYITYVANEWIKENELSVENGLKAEMAESMLLSLKEAFESNYISVSEEKVDVLENMANEIEELKTRLNSEFEKRLNLENDLESYKISELVGEMSEGMTAYEKDKFLSLVENISYSNIGDFSSKIEVLKETYFSGGAPRNTSAEPLLEDYDYSSEQEKEVPSNMRAYSEALARISKK